MERHLRRLRKLYGAKSSLLIQSLQEAFGSAFDILLEETALCLLLAPRSACSARELCLLALENGVRVQTDSGGERIRLGFSGIPLTDISPAVACLKQAWESVLT